MNDIRNMYDVIFSNVYILLTITQYTFLLTIIVVLAIKAVGI